MFVSLCAYHDTSISTHNHQQNRHEQILRPLLSYKFCSACTSFYRAHRYHSFTICNAFRTVQPL